MRGDHRRVRRLTQSWVNGRKKWRRRQVRNKLGRKTERTRLTGVVWSCRFDGATGPNDRCRGKNTRLFLPRSHRFSCLVPYKTQGSHVSHAPCNTHTITATHTSSKHTNMNHYCSLEGKPAVYFPQGSSSSTVSAQHPHWVNEASRHETQRTTAWLCVWMQCVLAVFPLQ